VHNRLRHVFWVRHLLKDEALFFCGGLHTHVAVPENASKEPMHISRDVLHPKKLLLGNRSVEKAQLFNVDNAFVSDNPRIQVKI